MTLTPTARNLLATVVIVGLLIAAVGAAVYSAYTSVTANQGNEFTAGSISLSDNDAGNALFTVQGFTPGDSFVKCIEVDYSSTGGVQSNVKLYGSTGGSGLDRYLDLRIRRGTMPTTGTSGDCTGFTPDATDYDGNGAGVIYDATLENFGDDYATGTTDPAPAWNDGDKAVYEITSPCRTTTRPRASAPPRTSRSRRARCEQCGVDGRRLPRPARPRRAACRAHPQLPAAPRRPHGARRRHRGRRCGHSRSR